MNIVLTGSLGSVGKPLTQTLRQKGNSITVISSNPARKNDSESLDTQAAIGTTHDVDFIIQPSNGADVVYIKGDNGSR